MNAPLLLLNDKRQIVENLGNPNALSMPEFFSHVARVCEAQGITATESHYMGFLAQAFAVCENEDGAGQISIKDIVVLRVLNVTKRGYSLMQQGYKIPFDEKVTE